MSSITTVRSYPLYGRWELNVFQVSPENTLIGSADKPALDAPSRPWCRFVLTVNLWSSRFLAPRPQEDHPIDDRINEIPMFASLRRLLQMDTKMSSGGAVGLPYTEPSSPWRHSRYKCAEIFVRLQFLFFFSACSIHSLGTDVMMNSAVPSPPKTLTYCGSKCTSPSPK